LPDAGQYLIHITLVPDPNDTENRTQGERLDVHMGFKVGGGQSTSKNSMLLYAFFALAGLYVLYLSNAGFKRKVDEVIGKIKS
jgi:hypothetical protein